MFNSLMPGTIVPTHRHPNSNGMYIHFDPIIENFGCVLSTGVWYFIEVLELSILYEVKYGKYGERGSNYS